MRWKAGSLLIAWQSAKKGGQNQALLEVIILRELPPNGNADAGK
jgi:hypothetical protein